MHIEYSAPPTCARMMKSEAFGRVIAGPVGSGKTTAVLFELFRRACEQAPAADGLRYTRFALVRQTLAQLKSTVLKDVLSWLKGIAEYKVSESTIYIEIGDVRSEWIMIPLDNPEDQRRLLSLQITGAWMSEAIEMDVNIISPLAGRCGRYPGAAQGGCTWMGIIADTNMPSQGSPWHRFMTEPSSDWSIFIQPSGMSDEAENLEWLTQTPDTLKLPPTDERRRAQGRKYYERFVRSNSHAWCQRYVYAEFGDDPSGTAVFRDSFKRSFHVAEDVDMVSGYPLLMGLDFGRDPCAIICQPDHKGRLLVLEEIIAEDVGLETQLQRGIKPALMQERYLGRSIIVVGDPAGRQRSTLYEETSFDLIKRYGLRAYPAPTNDVDKRIAAVEAWLLGQRDGGPALLIDGTRCPTLVRALDGGYRFGKTRNGMRKPSPDKNEFSHIADAFQYACVTAHGGMGEMLANKLMAPPRRDRKKVAAGGWT
jgi:hypothetical protein